MMLNLHRNKLNYLIGETKARMTTLAIAVDKPVNEEKIIDILDQAFEDEPRFSGLYMLNSKGDVIASTTDLKSKVNLADRPYFTKAKKTKKRLSQMTTPAELQASASSRSACRC